MSVEWKRIQPLVQISSRSFQTFQKESLRNTFSPQRMNGDSMTINKQNKSKLFMTFIYLFIFVGFTVKTHLNGNTVLLNLLLAYINNRF